MPFIPFIPFIRTIVRVLLSCSPVILSPWLYYTMQFPPDTGRPGQNNAGYFSFRAFCGHD
jgi:hypothetical protein